MGDQQDWSVLANLATNQIGADYGESQLNDATNGKRKADDGSPSQSHQRAKRNRYISIACNECKRRKIKCNGQTPCQRCGNLSLECIYAPNCCNGFKDSQEFKEMSAHVASLQDQVNTLFAELSHLRAQLGQEPLPPAPPTPSHAHRVSQPQAAIDPSLQASTYNGHQVAPFAPMSPISRRPRSQSQQQQSSFRGPTSDAFNFGVAKSSLHSMGITGRGEMSEINSGVAGAGTAATTPERILPARQLLDSYHTDKDPIWQVSKDEAIRLCRVYEDEISLMYPVLDINKVLAYIQKLYRFMEAAHRSGLMQTGMPGSDTIDDEDTNILKLVLAIAMTAESAGNSELGNKMFAFVQPAVDNLLLGHGGVKGIRLLALTAMFEFNRDNEGTSWRIIGLTARLCIELGLHRKETYDTIQDESERSETILLFWSIYVLDRRWSFGTGMPFALQDSDIDPNLPKPEDRSPYLTAMIQYSAIGSKVWRTVGSSPDSASPVIDREQMNYLDYQVVQWLRNIPPQLRFEHPQPSKRASSPVGPASTRAAHRLRALLYLRANQMRILIHRPVLYSTSSILQYREEAQTAIDVAKDSIRVLMHINQTSDFYQTQQVLFNPFLTSSLAVLFLAVCHNPTTFVNDVREEFDLALELVRGFSKTSFVGKRLWRTIRVLKEIGPKLGMNDDSKHDEKKPRMGHKKDELDPSRSAAVAMAGLAGHNVDETALYGGGSQSWSLQPGSNTSPEGMANDLTSLFEAAGGLRALGDAVTNGDPPADLAYHGVSGEGAGNTVGSFFGDDEGLSNILKDLF